MAETLTEKFSENPPPRKRGRPRKFDAMQERLYRGLWPDYRSKRSIHNAAAWSRAVVLLKDDPHCAWLFFADGNIRKTIMAELGRIPHDTLLIAAARRVSEQQMKTVDAVAYLRRVRLQRVRQGDADELCDRLIDCVCNYLTTHDGCDASMVLQGIQNTYEAMQGLWEQDV